MKLIVRVRLIGTALFLFGMGSRGLAEDAAGWNPQAAAKYLDQRAEEWLAFASAQRGQGNMQTTCISCHTLLPYALARPLLRKGTPEPTAFEGKMVTQARLRVANWKDLDGSKLRLLYDFTEQKKTESWGTEAVIDATILAFDDRNDPDPPMTGPDRVSRKTTIQALTNLWATQITSGPQAGAWNWLDFDNDPFESKNSPYFGAALAALALGNLPGRDFGVADPAAKPGIEALRGYLQKNLASQNLFNQAWAVWADGSLPILPSTVRKAIVQRLLDQQQADGGWRLSSLGTYIRHDKTAEASVSDGFATGLVLCAVRWSLSKNDPRVLKGMAWLKQNQQPTGEWLCESLNKKRNPSTNAGKLMTDAATAFAVLALAGEG
jgi:squalene-hopene/tetraprenyl-beta-curcumene cyclase